MCEREESVHKTEIVGGGGLGGTEANTHNRKISRYNLDYMRWHN